jgi:phosphate transport system substrate-binding protein
MKYYDYSSFILAGAPTFRAKLRRQVRSPKSEVRSKPEAPRANPVTLFGLAVLLALCLLQTGCGQRPGGGAGESASKVTIQNKGSDTMVNLAQAWAEEYRKVAPDVSVEVSGGGSGVGIAALVKGTIDIANASRNMKPEEIETAKKNTGKEPKEFIVGYDALAIYVHKDNPLNEITLDQIAQIYVEGGTITKWADLGVTIPGSSNDEIVRVSRQSSSGTYEFLREHVLNKKDFKLGSRDMNGSKEVVELVASTPTAIGYSGMGYATAAVKMLKVKKAAADPAFEPNVANTLAKTYPIARSLLVYTLGEPQGAVKKYIDWMMSDAGQKVVEATGYVPLPAEARAKP